MKYSTLLIAFALMASNAHSAEETGKSSLSELEREQIALAIKILVYSGTIKADANSCVQFDHDLLMELKKADLLKTDNSKLMSICIGSAPTDNDKAD